MCTKYMVIYETIAKDAQLTLEVSESQTYYTENIKMKVIQNIFKVYTPKVWADLSLVYMFSDDLIGEVKL